MVDANGIGTIKCTAIVAPDVVEVATDQGSQLVALGRNVVGNIDTLVPALIEQAVSHNWFPAPAAAVAAPVAAPTVPTPAPAPATQTA